MPLTPKQQRTIDKYLDDYPDANAGNCNAYYDHHCFARNYFIYLDRGDNRKLILTRCDWKANANVKVKEVRAYIQAKRK